LSEEAILNVEQKNSDLKELVYFSGKMFGYRYCKLLKIRDVPIIAQDSFAKQIFSYFESTYGTRKTDTNIGSGTYALDWKKHSLNFELRNVVLLRKYKNENWLNGALVGFWAGVFEDDLLEGKYTEKRGLNEVISTFDFSPGKNKTDYTRAKVPLNQRYYELNNKIQLPASYGLDSLASVGIMKYTASSFTLFEDRFFPMEISAELMLEQNIERGGYNLTDRIYGPTKKAFTTLGKRTPQKNLKDALDFCAKISTATGWGAVSIAQIKNKPALIIKHPPWTEELTQTKNQYSYLRGSVDGLLSGLLDKEVNSRASTDNEQNMLYLLFSD
jgi:hypothetical protein